MSAWGKRSSVTWLLAALSAAALSAVSASCSDSEKDDGSGPGDGSESHSGGTSGSEGGEGGRTVSAGEFTLLSQSPSSSAENLNARAPIVLEFSEELDASSVESAIRVRAEGTDISFTFEVEGDTLRIVLEEIPRLPVRLSVVITSDLLSTEGATFVGDSFTFELPVWQRFELDANGTDFGLVHAVNASGRALVATGTAALSSLAVDGESWLSESTPSSQIQRFLGATGDGELFHIAWKEQEAGQENVYVATLEEDQWTTLGRGAAASDTTVSAELLLDDSGRPLVVSLDSADAIVVTTLAGGSWATPSSGLSVPGIRSFSSAYADGRPVVAVVNAEADILVYEWAGSSWNQLGDTIDRVRSGDDPSVSLAGRGSALVLAYQDGDSVSQHLLVQGFEGSWAPLGSALDLELNDEVTDVAAEVSPDGTPLVAWVEELAGMPAAVAARREGKEWRVLGELAHEGFGASAVEIRTSVDAFGDLHVALLSAQGVRVAHFNGSPAIPQPSLGEGDRGGCVFPPEGDPNFPARLSDTGCYADLAAQRIVEAAIPYNPNSILWTDGAYKRRYVLIPEGGTIDFSWEANLDVPVGTVAIKEFSTEAVVGDPSSRIPVETRFFVKRCEEADASCDADQPWQGYTYQWNTSGTDGSLLDNATATVVDWTVSGGSGTYTHEYPTRAQCLECHNSAGRLLGFTGAQLNRPQRYGAIVENQIRALSEAGFFGSSGPSTEPEESPRLPSPPDVSRGLEERTRAYFQSNCSHCHRVGATSGAPVIPYFSYYGTTLPTGGICPQLDLDVPANSPVYVRDANRGDPLVQMPPIATRLPDTQQLPVTLAWIESLSPSDCP